MVNRRGSLLIADETNPGWVRRWIMIRRPFLYIYESEKDTLERRVINLKVAQLEYRWVWLNSSLFFFASADENEIFGSNEIDFEGQTQTDSTRHPMIFALKYADRKVLMKTAPNASRNEIHEWLYAIDPLMAGEIK